MRAPHTTWPCGREGPQAVDAERVEDPVLAVGELDLELLDARQPGVEARRRLPHAALGVGLRHHAGDRAGGRELDDDVALQGVGRLQVREVDGRVTPVVRGHRAMWLFESGRAGGHLREVGWLVPVRVRIDDEERPVVAAEGGRASLDRHREHPLAGGVVRLRDGRDDEQVEEVGPLERVDAGSVGGPPGRSRWRRSSRPCPAVAASVAPRTIAAAAGGTGRRRAWSPVLDAHELRLRLERRRQGRPGQEVAQHLGSRRVAVVLTVTLNCVGRALAAS